MNDRKCLNCGQPLTNQRPTAKYCNDRCRVAYHRATTPTSPKAAAAPTPGEIASRKALVQAITRIDRTPALSHLDAIVIEEEREVWEWIADTRTSDDEILDRYKDANTRPL